MSKRVKEAATKSPSHPLLPPAARNGFRKALLRWYDLTARDLPWRRTRDPYAIWLSEIMLQQTQVVTVIGYYERFLSKFPAITDLANAHEQEVLGLWEGLGYYRRARQLHAAAKSVADVHQGQFPRRFEQIRELPGIGRYTAGAIASFAFDDAQPIVEANTLRLYSRLMGLQVDPRSKTGQEQLWQFAESLLPIKSPGRINQALIELGSQVCKPRNPSCDVCPVSRYCAAKQLGLVDSIPIAPKKTTYEDALEAAVVIRGRRQRILLRQRGETERWAGMWDFPRGVLATGQAAREPQALRYSQIMNFVKQQTGATIEIRGERLRLRHGVTRFRIELVCLDAKLVGALQARDDLQWVTAEDLKNIPLSVSARKLAKTLTQQ